MIDKNIFKSILKTTPLSDLVQNYIFDSEPHCFLEYPERYYDFRDGICGTFGIHQQNFTIVGSAKIGFSLAPNKFGTPFNEASDIDVVLVSNVLFNELWLKLLDYKKSNHYKLDRYYKDKFEDMQKLMFYGNIRLDKLSDDFTFAKKWWEYFNGLSIDPKYGPRSIRGTIFKDWSYATRYYEYSLKLIRQQELKKETT